MILLFLNLTAPCPHFKLLVYLTGEVSISQYSSLRPARTSIPANIGIILILPGNTNYFAKYVKKLKFSII